MGHGDIHAQDSCRQAPFIRVEDGHQAQGQNRHTQWAHTMPVHQVRALADLAHAGWQPSDWARVMLHRRRKTVVTCGTCRDRIHSERPARPFTQ
ncbi:hypothetical protein [Streptomyces cadmiisoli]|uniref:HNH endonuclease n=1 Tax=Streptomyces cadmiisoli TaxID=2184053 RepID=UPI003CCC88F2